MPRPRSLPRSSTSSGTTRSSRRSASASAPSSPTTSASRNSADRYLPGLLGVVAARLLATVAGLLVGLLLRGLLLLVLELLQLLLLLGLVVGFLFIGILLLLLLLRVLLLLLYAVFRLVELVLVRRRIALLPRVVQDLLRGLVEQHGTLVVAQLHVDVAEPLPRECEVEPHVALLLHRRLLE